LDFSLLLVVLAALMGAIWAVDAVGMKPRRARAAGEGGEPAKEPWLVEISRSFFPIVLIVLVVRSFAYEPFRIPSSSMMPTLRVGDFIFVSKFAYGLRLPVVNHKFMDLGEPDRGDVVVFRLPSDPHTNYIKRVIGLPGDVVTLEGKQVRINGDPVPVELTGEEVEQECGGFWFTARVGVETIGDVGHRIYLSDQRDRPSPFLGRPVPEGQYLVMGDNRDCSRDGRIIGYIPEGNLVGKAVRIWMNWDSESGRPLWNRIGNRIE
jgi:signal peptidase I